MPSQNSTKSTASLSLFDRLLLGLIVTFAVVFSNVAFGNGGSEVAQASPLSTYNCTSNAGSGSHHCYAAITWPGAITGGKTTEKVEQLTCPASACYVGHPDAPSNWHVSNEQWLEEYDDPGHGQGDSWATSNCPSGVCWIETGYATWTTSSTSTQYLYIWADGRPCGGGVHTWSGNTYGNDLGFTTNVTISGSTGSGSHNCGGSTNRTWSATASSHYYGTGVNGTSTNNPFKPNHIIIGLEVYGNNSQSALTTDFTNNQWANNGSFQYQGNGGNSLVLSPTFGAWTIVPGPGGTGGDWQTYCNC